MRRSTSPPSLLPSLLAVMLVLTLNARAFADPVPGHTGDVSAGSPESTEFMHARYYSPNLGRFVSVDPVGGTVGSSQSWNRYGYVENNPMNANDPTGTMTDVPNTMTGEAFGKRPSTTASVTPQQRAISKVCMYPLVGTMALPSLLLAPELAPGVATGGLLGFVTSAPVAIGSDLPVDEKVDAVFGGTASGAVFGPVRVGPIQGALSSFVSRNFVDHAIGQDSTSARENAQETLNGLVAGTIGSIPKSTGPQSLTMAAIKLLLDIGMDAFETSEDLEPRAALSEEELKRAYENLYGGS